MNRQAFGRQNAPIGSSSSGNAGVGMRQTGCGWSLDGDRAHL